MQSVQSARLRALAPQERLAPLEQLELATRPLASPVVRQPPEYPLAKQEQLVPPEAEPMPPAQ